MVPRTAAEAELGRDALNRRAVEHYARYPLDGVLADFEFTAGLVRGIVADMTEENLALEAGEPWPKGTLVWQAIAGESHAHWKEHSDRLDAALAGGRGRADL